MKNRDSFSEGLSRLQLMELDSCTQCVECLKACPVQDVTGNPRVSPPEKIRIFREFIRATEGLKARFLNPSRIDRRLLDDFVKAVFECTTCGACGQRCTVGIFTQRLWPVLRKEMMRRGLVDYEILTNMPKAVRDTGNPYGFPVEKRYQPWFPETVEVAERSGIAYYAGCSGAYGAMPMVRGHVLMLGAIGEPFTEADAEDAEFRAAQKSLWATQLTVEGSDTDALGGEYRVGVHLNASGLHKHGQMWAEKVSEWISRL